MGGTERVAEASPAMNHLGTEMVAGRGGEMDTRERGEEREKLPRKDLSFPWHRGLNPRRRLRVELLNPASLEELSLWIRLRKKRRLKRNCRKRKRRTSACDCGCHKQVCFP